MVFKRATFLIAAAAFSGTCAANQEVCTSTTNCEQETTSLIQLNKVVKSGGQRVVEVASPAFENTEETIIRSGILKSWSSVKCFTDSSPREATNCCSESEGKSPEEIECRLNVGMWSSLVLDQNPVTGTRPPSYELWLDLRHAPQGVGRSRGGEAYDIAARRPAATVGSSCFCSGALGFNDQYPLISTEFQITNWHSELHWEKPENANPDAQLTWALIQEVKRNPEAVHRQWLATTVVISASPYTLMPLSEKRVSAGDLTADDKVAVIFYPMYDHNGAFSFNPSLQARLGCWLSKGFQPIFKRISDVDSATQFLDQFNSGVIGGVVLGGHGNADMLNFGGGERGKALIVSDPTTSKFLQTLSRTTAPGAPVLLDSCGTAGTDTSALNLEGLWSKSFFEYVAEFLPHCRVLGAKTSISMRDTSIEIAADDCLYAGNIHEHITAGTIVKKGTTWAHKPPKSHQGRFEHITSLLQNGALPNN